MSINAKSKISLSTYSFMLLIQTCADELECVVIQCPLEAVDSAAVIVLHSRLSNSTFLGVWVF